MEKQKIIIIIIGMVFYLIGAFIFWKLFQKKTRQDPHNPLNYFKKYNIKTKQDFWKAINDSKTRYEDKQYLSELWFSLEKSPKGEWVTIDEKGKASNSSKNKGLSM